MYTRPLLLALAVLTASLTACTDDRACNANADCPTPQRCDPTTHRCVASDASTDDAGTDDASTDDAGAPNPTGDVLAYWPLDIDGRDLGPHGHDLTGYFDPIAGPFGALSDALSLYLLSLRSEVITPALHDFNEEDFTLSLWFRHAPIDPVFLPDAQPLFALHGEGATDEGLTVSLDLGSSTRGQLAFDLVGADQRPCLDNRFFAGGALDDGAWHQVVFAKSTGLIHAYVDGRALGQAPIRDDCTLSLQVSRAFIGAASLNAEERRRWEGDVDDVLLLSRALDAAEIGLNFDSGTPWRTHLGLGCETFGCARGACVDGVCACEGAGYEGARCDRDVDECAAPNDPCPNAHAVCENRVGGFECVCDDVSVGDGQHCTECAPVSRRVFAAGVPLHDPDDAVLVLHLADLDGDGALDLLVATADALQWYPAGLDVSAPPNVLTASDRSFVQPTDIKTVDLNDDGYLDVVAVSQGLEGGANASIAYVLNQGGGVMLDLQTIATPARRLQNVEIADLNEDGRPDIFASGGYYTNLGGPMPTFEARADPFANARGVCDHVALADLNADGRADAMCSFRFPIDDGPGGVVWTLYEEDSFLRSAALVDTNTPVFVDAADLNGDEGLDIFYAFSPGAESLSIAVHDNQDDGGFGPVRIIANDLLDLIDLQAHDLNGDGLADLLAVTASGLVWFEQTNALFNRHPIELDNAARNPMSAPVAVGDLDGDGDLDIVAFDQDTGLILYFDNAPYCAR